MAWKIELSVAADWELGKLDTQYRRRVLKFLEEKLAVAENPRSMGKALQGARFGELWRYRVGPIRLICKIEDERLLVLVLRIGHRKDVYR